MKILGIETSCDDTCLSITENGHDIFSIKKSSENKLEKYNGIIPEIASRNHEKEIIDVLSELKNKIDISTIDYISYTYEPGLSVCLHVGKIFAQTISYFLNKPLIPVNHIYGHIFSSFINKPSEIKYPFLSLIASGGTTSLYLVESCSKITEINKTSDDAIGEAFDKVGRILGLKYPGGPSIDKIYNHNKVNKDIFKFQNPSDHFSFSGIKTKIINLVNKNKDIDIVEIASSFQYWAIKIIVDKIVYYSQKYNIDLITIGGGVSSNSLFREMINSFKNIKVIKPDKEYTCDNATMISFYTYVLLKNQHK